MRPVAESMSALEEDIAQPPPPPRAFPNSYAWRFLLTDSWGIVAGILALLGFIFAATGAGLILGIVTALIGIPFFGVGAVLFALGVAILAGRYNEAQKFLAVLRYGDATRGQVTEVERNLTVRINHQHPWIIHYAFQWGGNSYQGRVSTLNSPGPQLQVGQAVCVLYLPENPARNALYPHP
jgi:hypothetical protein